MIEVDEGVRRPQQLAQLVSRDDIAPPFEQALENTKGLVLQPDSGPVLSKLAGARIEFEDAEPNDWTLRNA